MKLITIIIFFSVLCSCNSTTTKAIIMNDSDHIFNLTYSSLLPNKKFDSVVLSFIKENPCDSCIDEIYIDKVSPAKFFITLKQRVYNVEYLRKQNPLFTIRYGVKQFFIYSGVEDIFVGDKKLMPPELKDANNKSFVQWQIIIDSNEYIINKKYEGPPFFPPPKNNNIPKISGILSGI